MNKWRAPLLVAVAIGFGAAARSHTASPALPAPSSLPVSAASAKIAFITTGGPFRLQLSVINADGSGERRLADLGPWVAQRAYLLTPRPAWSPDGQTIAYVCGRDDGNLDIYVVRVDGRERRRLTRVPAVDGNPVWSPDGRKIAFTRQGESRLQFQIYVMNADGSRQRRLTRNGWLHFSVAWSPDGRKMLFERPDFPRTDAEELWIMNADGSGQRRLTRHPARDGGPVWSPDGRQIVFAREWKNGRQEIYVMNDDGSGKRSLTRTRSSFGPEWSPDGRRIAFFSDGDIYVMNADGSEQRRLTRHPGSEWSPRWSPDGQMIAFERDRASGEELHVMNADGSGLRRLTGNGVRYVIPFAWSPTLPKRP